MADVRKSAAPNRIRNRGARFLRRNWKPLLLIGFIVLVLAVFREVLTPFIIAFALAYVLLPAVQRISRVQVRGNHLPIWGSILVVYAVLLGGIGVLVSFAGPPVWVQLQKLIDAVPEYARLADRAQTGLTERIVNMMSTWEREERVATSGPGQDEGVATSEPGRETLGLGPEKVRKAVQGAYGPVRDQVIAWLKGLGTQLPAAITALVQYIFDFFLVLMLTFMFIVYFPTISKFARRLVPPDYIPEFEKVAAEINRRLAGVVRGQLLICLINGMLTYIGFRMIGVNFSILLACVAAILSLIPIFGTIISSVPAVLIGLTQSLSVAVMVLCWIIVIHMIEAYILNPKIMGETAHMNPLLIVFALLVGSHYFHPILGPLLAAPIAAIIQTVFLHLLTREEPRRAERIVAEEVLPEPARVEVGAAGGKLAPTSRVS
ncbi:MAG TPA: AI-2E family transporter [Phycisphaerae bacterium]